MGKCLDFSWSLIECSKGMQITNGKCDSCLKGPHFLLLLSKLTIVSRYSTSVSDKNACSKVHKNG